MCWETVENLNYNGFHVNQRGRVFIIRGMESFRNDARRRLEWQTQGQQQQDSSKAATAGQIVIEVDLHIIMSHD